MGEFHRSPSKVWWLEDRDEEEVAGAIGVNNDKSTTNNSSNNWEGVSSSSPGSQDSGFSDTESSSSSSSSSSPNRANQRKQQAKSANGNDSNKSGGEIVIKKTPDEIRRDVTKSDKIDGEDAKNLSSNVKDKITPKKKGLLQTKDCKRFPSVSCTTSNVNRIHDTPILNGKRSSDLKAVDGDVVVNRRINRNLFKNVETRDDDVEQNERRVEVKEEGYNNNQYARSVVNNNNVTVETKRNVLSKSVKRTQSDTSWWFLNDNSSVPEEVQSLPNLLSTSYRYLDEEDLANFTAPAFLLSAEEEVNERARNFNRYHHSNNSSFSGSNDIKNKSVDEYEDDESLVFNESAAPLHTSTPKTRDINKIKKKDVDQNLLKKTFAKNLMLKYQNERVPPTTVTCAEDGTAVDLWLKTLQRFYEQECMITLQCKSIAAELQDKVNVVASRLMSYLREILSQSNTIEWEFDNIKTRTEHLQPLSQSLTGLIKEFFEKYGANNAVPLTVQNRCNDLRRAIAKETSHQQILMDLYDEWRTYKRTVLEKEVKTLVDAFTEPKCELDVRGAVTALIALALRQEELIEIFVQSDAIENLIAMCEKCDGSTVRTLILRALTTLCTSAPAIRLLAKSQGLVMLRDVVVDETRPEPERSECIALLAQITAPWIIEDNHQHVKGLNNYNGELVQSITRFVAKTNCCQNLLLCTASLANLTTMFPDCLHYILDNDTIKYMLEAVRKRGPRISVYLLEQLIILMVNMTNIDGGRRELIKYDAITLILSLLHTNLYNNDDENDVMKRIQQKSIIALSKLCNNNKSVCKTIVDKGGIEKLVKLCRDKKERYGSDAVLVASLATLRKIVEKCGCEVVKTQDVQELIEPRLLDTFLAYSSQNESYV